MAHLSHSTSYTRAEIEALTLWDVQELMDYEAEHPPAHIILAARYLKPRSRPRTPDAAAELKGAVLSIGGAVKRASEMPEYLRKK